MNKPTEPAQLDDLLHRPAHLRLCASLAPMQWLEHDRLGRLLGVDDAALHQQLQPLQAADYVLVERFTLLGRHHHRVSLSKDGRQTYVRHLAALRQAAAKRDDSG